MLRSLTILSLALLASCVNPPILVFECKKLESIRISGKDCSAATDCKTVKNNYRNVFVCTVN